jgi:hypothetical protein
MISVLFHLSGATWSASIVLVILLVCIRRSRKRIDLPVNWYYQIAISVSIMILFSVIMFYRMFVGYTAPTIAITTISTGVYFLIVLIFILDTYTRWKE